MSGGASARLAPVCMGLSSWTAKLSSFRSPSDTTLSALRAGLSTVARVPGGVTRVCQWLWRISSPGYYVPERGKAMENHGAALTGSCPAQE